MLPSICLGSCNCKSTSYLNYIYKVNNSNLFISKSVHICNLC
uniref:Uncharacterized protein n=2 Tax=unclassified Caudoviricetes TaxID=2788787 RepID=A0A8S5VB46_9CAUD|nr:MAG TPA: hypothetical protein [Siphoviridae sp. ctfrT39]DAG03912.1 MAG TPA: hypothetical protein [Siphoviridae sp. ct0vA12]